MLFNTFSFFLIFLPLSLLGYFLLSRYSLRLSIVFLLVASLLFYVQWDMTYLPLLLGSIAANYLAGRWICRSKKTGNNPRARLALPLGVAFNLGLLGCFKYLDFLIASLAWLTGTDLQPTGITLPLGISFFTFTQIAYLVDCHSSQIPEYDAPNYGLFVSYFPHLIAGPIIHHKDVMPQFAAVPSHVFVPGRLVLGMMFFVIGLIKKVVLADNLGRFVPPVFDVAHVQLSVIDAWCGALAYTFQLYFDFSAYSDMAYGLSYMFGIILPINFNSPYKACSIIDFWRRWHMTLSGFLRQYLYIQLGGNRLGSARRYLNLFITMLLGGLWHGASWTFVLWGGLHGIYLAVNHALRKLPGARDNAAFRFSGWLATFLAVVAGWVVFRAGSFHIALEILQAMLGSNYAGGTGTGFFGSTGIVRADQCLIWLSVAALIAFFAPNAYQLIGWGLQKDKENRLNSGWGAVALGGLTILALLILAIGEARGGSQFLYFNF